MTIISGENAERQYGCLSCAPEAPLIGLSFCRDANTFPLLKVKEMFLTGTSANSGRRFLRR